MSKPEKRQKARLLRKSGQSIKSIAQEIGVSTSTISRWVSDIKLSHEQIEHLKQSQKQWASQNKGAQKNRENAFKKRLEFQQNGRNKAKEMETLHMQGCMLYWAEGAKDKNRVEFVNSDVNMMKIFIRFLRECLDITNNELSIRIHCHTADQSEIDETERYWSNELEVPIVQFTKTQIKQGSNSRKNRLEHGICAIRVDNTEKIQHIFGAIQEYGGFDNPDWLF